MNEWIWEQRNLLKVDQDVTTEDSPRQQFIKNKIKSNKVQSVKLVEEQDYKGGIEYKRRFLSRKTKAITKEMPQYLISFNSSNLLRWDTFILLLALWNCIYIPYDIAFEPPVSLIIEGVNAFIDFLFYLDVIINFRITYMTTEGEEIQDEKQIARRYVFEGTFILDLLSVIPFNTIIPMDLKILDILGILKLVRIKRLPKLIQRLNLRQETKAVVQIFQTIFMMVFYFHVQACFWYFVVKQEEIWIPPPDLGSAATNIYMHETDILWKYATCFHLSVMTLTGNEQAPRNDKEIAVASFMILIAYLANANIFGQMAALVQALNKKKNYFLQQIDSANTAMKNIYLPSVLQQEIRDYLILTQSTQDQQKELDSFLSLICPSLKLKVSWQLFHNIINDNEVFKVVKKKNRAVQTTNQIDESGLGSDFVSIVVRKLEIMLTAPETIITHQGDIDQDIYIVAQGDTWVSIKDTQTKEYKNFRNLKANQHFGEISAIYGVPRTAKVQSGSYSTYAKLSYKNYLSLAAELPELIQAFENFIPSYQDKWKMWFVETLRKLTFFQEIEEIIITKIIYNFKSFNFDSGTIIQEEGKIINYMFIVQDGILEALTFMDGKEFVLEKLGRGSIINSRIFFMEEKAQIFLRAATPIILLGITHDRLTSYQKEAPLFEKKYLSHQLKLLNSNKSFPLDYLVIPPNRISKQKKAKAVQIMSRLYQHKLMVFRRLLEIRQERTKPRLQTLLKGYRHGTIYTKMGIKKALLDLYEQQDGYQQTEIPKDPEDEKEENQTYLSLKYRLKKSIREVEDKELALEDMKNRLEKFINLSQ